MSFGSVCTWLMYQEGCLQPAPWQILTRPVLHPCQGKMGMRTSIGLAYGVGWGGIVALKAIQAMGNGQQVLDRKRCMKKLNKFQ